MRGNGFQVGGVRFFFEIVGGNGTFLPVPLHSTSCMTIGAYVKTGLELGLGLNSVLANVRDICLLIRAI